jgi:hypothetical protein
LYPNPNNGNFHIAGTVPAGDVVVNVYNTVGQLVHNEKVRITGNYIDNMLNLAGKLAEGMYLVQVKAGEEMKAFRVMVKQD